MVVGENFSGHERRYSYQKEVFIDISGHRRRYLRQMKQIYYVFRQIRALVSAIFGKPDVKLKIRALVSAKSIPIKKTWQSQALAQA
ncbi:hypothetical protein [Alkalihalobacillus sp. TS-13]|uniref:hypothetical protein n=1 Tax=Alkalihalobacillus sp. TS-13 TaxID=2842455 RepID=UPI001C87234B|nr:hypothetical protein [Alkalihalobacillus sp. TS-13]